jgi:quinol monooxygenase YgiN
MAKPVPTLVSYYPKPGKEAEMLALVKKHWPTLRRLGLASEKPAQIWRAHEKDSTSTYFVELFEWADEKSSDVAHQTPDVMAIWEPMGPILANLQIVKVEPV